MFKFVQKLLTRHPQKSRDILRQEVLQGYDEIGRTVAQRFVRGNVNIKAGRFLTAKDLAARKRG
jgi:hypothetical protein